VTSNFVIADRPPLSSANTKKVPVDCCKTTDLREVLVRAVKMLTGGKYSRCSSKHKCN